MTSAINPNDINDAYPVAGQPNNTQGFRDNFAATKTNFEAAASEITELQTKSVLTAALTGGSALTTQNNLLGAPLIGAKIRNFSADVVNIATTSGPVTINYSQGHYQRVATTGNIGLNFTNWPTSGSFGITRVQLNIDSAGRTVTLPAAVTYGTTGIEGIANNVITFADAGTYQFDFSTSDGGGNITIQDLNRPLNIYSYPVHITANTVSTSATTGALIVNGGVGVEGNLNIGGNFTTYTSSGNVAFQAETNGFVTVNAPVIPANTNGALNIVGTTDGSYQPVLNAGSMIHVTGNDNMASRITNDSFGNAATTYSIQTHRRARGTTQSPSAVQAGDILGRWSASGWGNVGYVLAAGNIATNSIDIVALETHSSAAGGSAITFYTSPVGSVARILSANVTSTVTTFPANVAIGGSGGLSLTDGGTMGYNTGAGGTVTQSGNKSSGVTLNKPSGEITMASSSLAAGTAVSFVLTNNTIGAHDLMVLNIVGGATAGAYNINANCTTGSSTITVTNRTAGSLSEAIVLRYAVIKGSIA